MTALTDEYQIVEKEEFSFSDALDPEIEEILIRDFVNLGLEETDAGKWHIHEQTDKIKIDYKVSKRENIYTIRSETVISDADIQDYFKFCKTNQHYHEYLSSFLGDEQTKWVQTIDKNHNVLYSSIKPGYYNSYFVAPRDFCYVQTRFRFEDYQVPSTKIILSKSKNRLLAVESKEEEDEVYDYVVGTFCYTNNNHPYYVNEKVGDNIRGNVIRSGYILAQLDYDSFRAINLFCCDWSGKLPYWFINNYVSSYNGDKIKKFHHEWFGKIVKSVEDRKSKKHKKHKKKKHHHHDDGREMEENAQENEDVI